MRKGKRIIKSALASILALTMIAQPALSLMVQAADGVNKTIVIKPKEASVFNDTNSDGLGEFQGFGTSLCWWANRVGNSGTMASQAGELFFDAEKGLGMTIGRYNLGGGDNVASEITKVSVSPNEKATFYNASEADFNGSNMNSSNAVSFSGTTCAFDDYDFGFTQGEPPGDFNYVGWVNGLGDEAGSGDNLHFTVNAPAEGTYTFKMLLTINTSNDRSMGIRVFDGESYADYSVGADEINAGQIAKNSNNDMLFVVTIKDVTLKAGENQVNVAGVNGWGLDFIKMAVIASGDEGKAPEGLDETLHKEHIIRSDSGVPGYWKDVTKIDLNSHDEAYYQTNFDQYDLDCGYAWNYDWEADSAQLNVLKSAIANAGADSFITEVFSNSPPYFMTNSGCSSGNYDANVNNLRDDSYVAFAKYMADVIAHLEANGIKVQSTTPVNEPYTNYWQANSNKQEGCHFDQGTSQSKIIVELNKQLAARGLNVIISGTDETSIDTQISSYNKLSEEAKDIVSRIDTHTYSGSKRSELKKLAQDEGKNLWMSEVDGAFTGGTNAGEMSAAIGLAKRMFTDINGLESSAWILWNAIDMHADASEYGQSWVNKGSENDYLTMDALMSAWQKKNTDGYWGLAAADHNNDTIRLTQKYYAFGQLSRYIRPGMTIIGSSDEGNTLVAYDSENKKLVIVSINDKESDKTFRFDLSLFNSVAQNATVSAYRTSGSMADGEHWADVTNSCAIALDVVNKNFTATAKANSITTYVVEGVTFDAKNPVEEEALVEIPLDASMVTGSTPWNNGADTCDKAVDGNFGTFFDGLTNGYLIVELQDAEKIAAVGVAGRSGYAGRTVGAVISGSNDKENWTQLYTIESAASTGSVTMYYDTDFAVTGNAYKYIKYSNAKDCANIAEFRLYKRQEKLVSANDTYLSVAQGKVPSLPETVKAVTDEGRTTTAYVDWQLDRDDFTNAQLFDVVTVTGMVDGCENQAKAYVLIAPSNLEYLIDCNNADSQVVETAKKAVPSLLNATADQKKTADNSWGRTADYGDYNDSHISWSGWYAYKNQNITYKFTLPAGNHVIKTGMQGDWWGAPRAQSYYVSVNGGEEKLLYSTEAKKGLQTGEGTIELASESEVTLTVKGSGSDPVLSWILISSVADTTYTFTGVAGEQMFDTDGNRIQAHGGQIQKIGDTYYWIGEDKTKGAQPCYGVHMYSSQDLYNWTDEGIVLKTMTSMSQFDTDSYFKNLYAGYTDAQKAEVFKDLAMGPDSNGAYNAIIERPKFLYNESTGKYVMWFHCDGKYPDSGADSNYGKARAGIAIADSPAGPYKYVGSYLLASGTADGEADHSWDNEGGHVRDMNLFKDDDGKAYVIYSSEGNEIMYIARLNDSYTGLAKDADKMVYGEDFTIASTDSREAPAMFKYNGKYYLVTSGCTGWAPNTAAYAVADSVLGKWTRMGDPCESTGNSYSSVNGVGVNTSTTWYSQPTCVIPVDAAAGKFIYMGDRWYNPDTGYDITDSRYVWLPIEFSTDDSISIKDYSNWTLEDLNGKGAISLDDSAIPTVVSSARELEGRLPATLNITVGGKYYANSPVSWTVDETDLALAENKLGYTTVTGYASEIDRSFKLWILTVPKNLVYFADCYTNNETNHSDMFDLVKANAKNLMNSVSDQAKTADGDATWGYTSVPGAEGATGTQDMGSKGEGDFFATGWWATSKGTITYSYTLPAGTYDIATGFNEWWSATRGMKITAVSVDADGRETELKSMSFTLKNETELEKVLTDVTVPEGSHHVLIKVSKTSGGDPILSWMAIRAQDVEEEVDTDYSAGYLWTFFKAHDGYEKIYLGYSEDGLNWVTLNNNKPILVNDAQGSDLGVRDPHIIRSNDGKKYWIIGTDLHAEGGGKGGSGWNQESASKNIVVWESDDLVNWSKPQIVCAGFETAGCVWAPEAIWDEATGDYLVYYSVRDTKNKGTSANALRVYTTHTSDFKSFTTPKLWCSEDVDASEVNIIDATLVYDDSTGRYYRFCTSDWNTVIDYSTSLAEDAIDVNVDATRSAEGNWTRLVTRAGSSSAGFDSREGFTVYKLPDGRWCAMGDKSGYVPFVTSDLASGKWTKLNSGYSFDDRFRHGTVMRLSSTEEAAVLAAYGNREPEPGESLVTDKKVLASFNFDNEETGFVCETAKATGSHSLVTSYCEAAGKALKVSAGSRQFLTVTDANGKSLLTGIDEMTVSYDIKLDASNKTNWSFFAAPNSNPPDYPKEHYVALFNEYTTLNVQRYNNVNGRPDSAVAALGSDWVHVDVTFNETVSTIYVNGKKVSVKESDYLLSDILGGNSVLYIGKATWGGGEYSSFEMDNLVITNYALSADGVKESAAAFLGNQDMVTAATVGSAPDRDTALTYKGGDTHTSVLTKLDKTGKKIVSYVRNDQDLTACPVTFELSDPNAAISIGLKKFNNGSTVDLTSPVTFTIRSGNTAEEWTVETPVLCNNTVLNGQFADPDIDYFDGKFWIYPTTDGFSGWSGYQFKAFSSVDLVNWTDEGTILDLKAKEVYLNENRVEVCVPSWATGGSAWAPTIEKKNGKYYFYYCGKKSNGESAIGVAVASSPAGPFEDLGQPLIQVAEVKAAGCSIGQAIDPSIFTEDDGTSYILFGNGSGAGVIAKLSEDMMSIVPADNGKMFTQITGLTEFRESVVVTKVNGKYHWTWSCDDANSPNYHVNYAMTDSLFKADGTCGVSNVKKNFLSKNEELQILGSAHQSMVTVTDEGGVNHTYMAYHRFYTPTGIFTSGDGLGVHRETCVDEVSFNADGTMKVVPTLEGVSAIKVDATKSEPKFGGESAGEETAEQKFIRQIDATAASLRVNGADDVRGNLVLPTVGSLYKNVMISWTSSNPSVVSKDGIVNRPASDTDVILTAEITAPFVDYKVTKTFTAKVKAAPVLAETTDYLFAYFMGEGYANGEQIYFSASQDGLNWKTLNGGEPVITSELGEKGLRDPFIMRSHEGDKFYLIATDLKINGSGDWTKAQEAGSTSIMVWESADLVNWSAQRMCEIAPATAGCTWAPEAFWDEQSQDYVVFWASKTAADGYSKQRIYKCHTRDFYTYSEPELWIEFKDASGNVKSVIDTTMIKVGSTYYRISKNEENSKVDGINGKSVFLEKSDSIDGTWTRIASDSLNKETGVEGATSFKFNADDADGDKWCILVDNNGGVGYYPLVTEDLSSGVFTKLATSEYDFKARLRHGSVLNLTSEEYARVMKAYGNAAEVSTKTESAEKSLIANITFTDGKVVDSTGLAAGEIHGNVAIDESGVAIFDGRSYISLTKADGSALLDGIGEEITIAYTAKTNDRGSNCGWTVFAAKNDTVLNWPPADETYIGVMDKTDGFAVERYNVARANADSYKAEGIAGNSAEKRVVITMGRQEIRIYENGQEVYAGKNKNLASLSDMFGADSVFWIGKANWKSGEFYKGTMTDLQVYSKLLSAEEIAQIYKGTGLPEYPAEPEPENPPVNPSNPGTTGGSTPSSGSEITVTVPVTEATPVQTAEAAINTVANVAAEQPEAAETVIEAPEVPLAGQEVEKEETEVKPVEEIAEEEAPLAVETKAASKLPFIIGIICILLLGGIVLFATARRKAD